MLRLTLAAASLILLSAAPPAAATGGGAGLRWRGVLEGFYGRPWSWRQRRRMVRWMGGRGFNLFVLSPKDDLLHRKCWRRPLTRRYFEGLQGLMRTGREQGVEIAWGLSPVGLREDDYLEVRTAAAKYESVLALGIRKLVLGFDDTHSNVDQIRFANRLIRRIARAYPDVEMTFVPAEYWGDAAPSLYLDYLRRRLDPRFRVGWTGPQIISRSITAGDIRRFRRYVRHDLVLGDNYPVQDRLAGSGRLFLGPLMSRPVAPSVSGAFLANAGPLPAASRIALYTVADYVRDPGNYDAMASWRAAAEALGGRRGGKWLWLLMRENASSWLSVPMPAELYRGSAARIIGDYWAGGDSRALRERLRLLERLPVELRRAMGRHSELYWELYPWTYKLRVQAQAALLALDLIEGGPAGERREAALERFAALRLRAERHPAVVADLAFDRFLNRATALLEGGPVYEHQSLERRVRRYCRGEGAVELLRGLKRLGDAPKKLSTRLTAAQGGSDGIEPLWLNEAVPWIGVLALSAKRAQALMERSGGPAWVRRPFDAAGDTILRWRIRLSFLPLHAAKALMEEHFSRVEALRTGDSKKVKRVAWELRAWLLVRRLFYPKSLPVVLDRQFRRYARTADGRALTRTFLALRGLPDVVRTRLGGAAAEEIGPWLDKVGQYGDGGLKSMALLSQLRLGKPVSRADRRGWEGLRYGLRSGNGLELALELKLLIDALSRWQRIPPPRPPLPDLRLPADPAAIL